LTEEQVTGNPVRITAQRYQAFYDTLPAETARGYRTALGPAPGELFVDRSRDRAGEIVLAALRAGERGGDGAAPRGFGDNPSPSTRPRPARRPTTTWPPTGGWPSPATPPPPTAGFRRDAMVHVGSTQPGVVARQELRDVLGVRPDAALGDLPLV